MRFSLAKIRLRRRRPGQVPSPLFIGQRQQPHRCGARRSADWPTPLPQRMGSTACLLYTSPSPRD
eukprot:14551897-Alexandrium_andersonii.AAC.1